MTDKYVALARKIAEDGHCRYCHNVTGIKCSFDIQETTNEIARALHRVVLEAKVEAFNQSIRNGNKGNRRGIYSTDFEKKCVGKLRAKLVALDAEKKAGKVDE